ncbi:MAG: beta-lactamase family protein [Gemmatimonadales bacterium]|nr:beta-lactamase family protein [Gemmatimonadales bacterium]
MPVHPRALVHFASVLAAATFGATGLSAQQPAAPDRALAAGVDSVFTDYDRSDSPGCALGVIRDGALVYARGYGMANLDLGTALAPNSVLRIGSTSKQFTAAVIVLLAQDGTVHLDDDIRTYLPEIPDYGSTITIRQLLHHTSGIRDYLQLMALAGLRDDDWYTDDEVVAMIARQRTTNFAPGSEHLYSNSGYFLLSQIVKRATGRSLRDIAEDRLFRPLGMTHTHFHDDHTEIVPDRASGYAPDGAGGYRISMTTLDMVGDGGVFTTVEDLLQWDRNFYEPRVGGPAFLEMMLRRGVLTGGDTLDYALGLMHQPYRGLRTVRHGGAFVGYRAELIRFPEQRFSVICLCNRADASPTGLAERVADVYLSDVLAARQTPVAASGGAPTPVSVDREQLSRWAGLYRRLDAPGYFRFEVRNDSLVLMAFGNLALVPVAPDRFILREAPVEFRFAGDARQTRVTLLQSGNERAYVRVDAARYAAGALEAFVGVYHSEELGVDYHVVLSDGGLRAQRGRGDPMPLLPTVADEFMLDGDVVRFERDADQRPSAFVLDAGRVRGMRFVQSDVVRSPLHQ